MISRSKCHWIRRAMLHFHSVSFQAYRLKQCCLFSDSHHLVQKNSPEYQHTLTSKVFSSRIWLLGSPTKENVFAQLKNVSDKTGIDMKNGTYCFKGTYKTQPLNFKNSLDNWFCTLNTQHSSTKGLGPQLRCMGPELLTS